MSRPMDAPLLSFTLYSNDSARPHPDDVSVPLKREKTLKLTVVLLLLVLALALALRAVNVGHQLSWDEAWNVNSIQDAVTGHHNNATTFYPNMYRHPPLYTGLGLLYSKATGTGRVSLSIFLEIVSILFSLLLIVAIYLCGRDWFGEWAGLAAAFLFALMPAARVYDSWVKQESMTLFFGLLFLLFFFRKRYLVAGAFLGLALLSKEIIVFVPAALVVFILATRKWDRVKGFGLSLLIAVPLSAWWYLFLSRTEGQFFEFFLGKHASAQVWHKPVYSYIARIPGDIGWGGLVAVLLGLAVLAWQLKVFRRADQGRLDYAPRDMGLFLVVWLVIVYLVLSISYGKPPWMIYSALPAFALLGGWGIAEGYRMFSRRRVLVTTALVLLLVFSVAVSVPYGFQSYQNGGDLLYGNAQRDRAVARYINEKAGGDARVVLQDRDISPITMFYLDSYKSGGMYLLPLNPGKQVAPAGDPVLMLDDNSTPDQTIYQVLLNRPDFLLLESSSSLGKTLSQVVKPVNIRGTLVFDCNKLLQAVLQ